MIEKELTIDLKSLIDRIKGQMQSDAVVISPKCIVRHSNNKVKVRQDVDRVWSRQNIIFTHTDKTKI